jgi:predicted membrane channel-forming protein YqfA (hemolysin III family)
MYLLPKGLLEPLFEPIKNGFFIVMAVTILLLIFMLLKQKSSKSRYVWIIVHFVIFSLSGYLFFNTIIPPTIKELPQSIIYDEVRIRLSLVGITWIISMICLLIGIRRFQEQKQE